MPGGKFYTQNRVRLGFKWNSIEIDWFVWIQMIRSNYGNSTNLAWGHDLQRQNELQTNPRSSFRVCVNIDFKLDHLNFKLQHGICTNFNRFEIELNSRRIHKCTLDHKIQLWIPLTSPDKLVLSLTYYKWNSWRIQIIINLIGHRRDLSNMTNLF